MNDIRLSDSVIAHIVQLLQLGLLEGTDITDHFRRIRVQIAEGEAFLTEEYENTFDETVKKIIEFNPDILLSVDSPDFTLRVAEKVKKNNSKIKTIHYVAPQIWVWREGRVKKIKKYSS